MGHVVVVVAVDKRATVDFVRHRKKRRGLGRLVRKSLVSYLVVGFLRPAPAIRTF